MPGYRLSLQDTTSLDAKYLCSRCGDVLRDAVQTSCGHVYCQSCIGTLRGDDGLYTCPIDKDLFASDQIFPDNFMRREILSLEVSCPNSDEGCKWRGEIRHVEKHVLSCPVSKVRCTNPNCPQYVKRADLTRHMTTECQYRPEPCSYCGDSVTAAVMKHHQAHDCRMYPIACPACEKEGIPRGELASHQNPSTGDCDEIQKRCSFQAIGCRTSKEMKRSEAKRHDDLCAAFHLNLLLSFVLRIEEQVKMTLSVRGAGGFNEGWLRDSERMLSQAIMRIDSIVAETTDLRQKLRNHNDRLGELERKVGYRGNESSLFTSLQPNQMPLDELSRRITNAETNGGNNEALICDTAREVSNTRQEVSSLRTQLDRAVDTIRTLERRLESTEHSLALKNVALADLEEYMRQQEISSYDGTLLWKISDFARRKNDALTGRQASFYSTCFYTSRYGYKMCARMYLNGDGMGKGTHISVFFVVMRGEYDGLLRWPFRQKVTMMLLDQDNVEHVIDAFRPDPSSSSFQRPRREMNVASGCPLFCPLSDLSNHAYVRDDTMFFKIIVDTTDL